jgi:hypothetical protein
LFRDDDADDTFEGIEFGDDVFKMICRIACDREEFEFAAVVPDVRILIPSKKGDTDSTHGN